MEQTRQSIDDYVRPRQEARRIYVHRPARFE
jgi:hypothetical protein